MSDELPAAFHDLPPDALPFTIEFHKAPPDESPGPVKTITVAGPGALSVPGFGWPTWVRVRYADGSVYDTAPPAEDPGAEQA